MRKQAFSFDLVNRYLYLDLFTFVHAPDLQTGSTITKSRVYRAFCLTFECCVTYVVNTLERWHSPSATGSDGPSHLCLMAQGLRRGNVIPRVNRRRIIQSSNVVQRLSR